MKNFFHKMMTGYQVLFFKICTIIFIFAICLLFSFLIVYPLWLAATQYTAIYTATALSFFSLLFLFFVVKRSIKKYTHNPKKFFHTLIKRVIILTGFILFFVFIFSYQRVPAFSVLMLSFILYGFVAFGLSEDRF